MTHPPASSPAGAPRTAAARRLQQGRRTRFIGHLDVARLWERACRRAQVPLAYSLGFTPRPRLRAEAQAQGRPDDVLAALGLVARRVHRVRLGLAPI